MHGESDDETEPARTEQTGAGGERDDTPSDESAGAAQEASAGEASTPSGRVDVEDIGAKESFLSALCGGEENVDKGTCKACPTYTSPAETTDFWLPKDLFLVPGLEGESEAFALASFGDCAPEDESRYKTVVFERRSGTWERVDATEGVFLKECEAFPVPESPALFVCRKGLLAIGTPTHLPTLSELTLTSEGELEKRTLLETPSLHDEEGPHSHCNEVYQSESIEEMTYDSDAQAVVVEASVLHVEVPDDADPANCTIFEQNWELPEPETVRLELTAEDGSLQVPSDKFGKEGFKNVPLHEAPTTKTSVQ